MNNRQITTFRNQIDKLERTIGKKRDELRALVDDFNSLIGTAEEAADDLEFTVNSLKTARREFESAIDKASQLA